MNKKIVLGLISMCIVAVSIISYFLYMKQNGGQLYTVSLVPDKTTVRIGEYRNLTMTIVSSGYEGYIVVSEPNYNWTGVGSPVTSENQLEYKIIPRCDELNARFIEAHSELTFTLQIRWMGLLGTLYLSISVYGNYKQENQFEISSNTVTIATTLPP